MRVTTTLTNHGASGRRTSWYKQVTGVDESKKNGYAFDGEFVKTGCEVELEVGVVLIEKEPTGSVKDNGSDGNIYRVTKSAESNCDMPHIMRLDYFDWNKSFISLRTAVAEALRESQGGASSAEDDAQADAEIDAQAKSAEVLAQILALLPLLTAADLEALKTDAFLA
jgi:hypothetical protein